MNKKGLTLIELLATIVIIGVIALITMPIISNVVSDAKQKAFLNSVSNIIDAIDLDQMNNLIELKKTGKSLYVFPDKNLELKGTRPSSGYLFVNEDGDIKLSLWDQNIKKCAIKNYTDSKVTLDENIKDAASCSNPAGGNVTSEELKNTCLQFSDGQINSWNSNNCGNELIIPNMVDGSLVTSLGGGFLNGKEFTAVYFMGLTGITSFDNGAVQNISTLKTVVIADMNNLKTINGGSFTNNGIDTLVMSNLPTLTSISDGAFKLNQLTTIVIEKMDSLETISGGAFSDNQLVTKVIIRDLDKLTTINNGALIVNNKTGKISFTLENLPKLQDFNFFSYQNTHFSELKVKNVPYLTELPSGSFNSTTSIENLNLAQSNIETIKTGAFAFNGTLKKMSLPATLTTIESNAFGNSLTEIEKIEVLGDNPKRFNAYFEAMGVSSEVLPQ